MRYHKTRSTIVVMLVGLLPALLGFLPAMLQAQEEVVNFLTHHLNNARTGWNSNETVLTPDSVEGLHKLWQIGQPDINGQIYAAPLYYHVKGQELLFIATQTNWFYVLDANDGRILYGNPLPDEPPLNQFTFESKLHGGCGDINPWHGITSTPVIDPTTNTLYLVNLTMENFVQVYKAHAIDIDPESLTFGQEAMNPPGWPLVIQGRFEGRDFQAFMQTQRGALTLHDGFLYIPFSSRCDAVNWQGWIFGIDLSNPGKGAQYVFNTAPDGNGAGIWGQGGLSIDELGSGYLVTGNGTVNFPMGGRSYGMSVIRLDLSNFKQPFSRDPQDFWTPSDFGPTNARDTDLGGSSALVVPEQKGSSTPRLLMTAGKDGRAYLIDRDSMGGLSTVARPTELQFMRISRGQRMAPSYYESETTGGHYVYITSGQPGATDFGTYTDWEDGAVNMAPTGRFERADLGTGPAMVEFNDQLFVAWTNNTAGREVLVKSSPDGADWSAFPVEVGGFAAVRTSPALAVFNGKLYLSWIDNEKGRIKIKSSADGKTWSDEQTLDAVAPTTYTSLAEFNNKLYVAFIGSTPTYELLLRSTSDGQNWSNLISLNSSQGEPMSAPLIIPFNKQLYAFWIRAFNDPPFNDRTVVFKASKDGETWPDGNGTSFGVVVDQRSGISGFVLNSIIEDPTCVGKCQPISGPARLHILYLRNIRNPFIDVKSIGADGIVEPVTLSTYERARAASKVGAVVFRGRPRYAFVSNNPNLRNLLLKTGAAAFRGGGLTALSLYIDSETGESRFHPVWTSGRTPGQDIPPTTFDYLPGMPFVTSNGRQDGIVWVTEGGITGGTLPKLRAYNAVTGQELFNSETTGDPDDRINCGGRKFAGTVVVNGRVFLGTNCVMAYGLKE